MFKSADWKEAGVPVVKIGNVRPGYIDLAGCSFVDETIAQEASEYELKPSDIAIAMTGYVGEVAKVGRIGRALQNQRVGKFSVKDPQRLNANYLFYFLRQSEIKATLIAKAHGSAQPNLSNAAILSLVIPLPDIQQQQAIAEVLGALDDKIAANTKLADTITDSLATHFDDLGFVDEPDEDNELIPIGEFFDLNPTTVATTEVEPVYVDMQKIPTTGPSIRDWDHRPAKGGARFMNGDTLLARITPCLENRKTGYVDFLHDGQSGVGSTEFIVVRSREGIPGPLSYFLATSESFRTFAIRHMSGTSGRQRVSALDLSGFTIKRPDEDKLDAFGARSEAGFAMLKSLTDESRTLAATRDALLPQLMSGKLRVKDAVDRVESLV